MNKIDVTCNLCRDPNVIDTKNGNMAILRVADNYINKDKEKIPLYMDVKVFSGVYSKEVGDLRKGDRVQVVGRLVNEEFIGKDGEKRSSLVILCDSINKIERSEKVERSEKEHSF